MTLPTPAKTRPVTLHLYRHGETSFEVIGEFAARLIPNPTGPMLGTHAITHGLGSIAGGTHTEVAFADGSCGNRDLTGDGSFRDPEREALRDDIVRAVADHLYGAGHYAFTYRPDRVADGVLRHGSVVREHVEVSDVVIYA
jgi:hypothetical protein